NSKWKQYKYVSFSQHNSGDSGILGTIAGDDSLLLIVRSQTDMPKVLAALHEDFPYLPLVKLSLIYVWRGMHYLGIF
ncbi:MAG: hypothetical protein JSS07_03300, partial [Proteobacteria bacterium]|nr:hypothetical protein [Pseudomonadota bacterium]